MPCATEGRGAADEGHSVSDPDILLQPTQIDGRRPDRPPPPRCILPKKRGIYPIDINSPGNRPNRVGVTERTGARERSREIRIRRK